MHNLQIHEQGSTIQERHLSIGVLQPYFKSSEGISRTSLRRSVLTRFATKIFFYELLNARKQKKTTQRATYEDKISTFPQPSAALVFQEINHLNANVTRRSTYDEPLEVCPRGT